MTTPTITGDVLSAARAAYKAAPIPHGWKRDELLDTQLCAALTAAAPHIAAQVLRGYADREHPGYEGVAQRVDYGTGVEHDAVCSGCGSSWSLDEGGCSERVALLKAADDAERAAR
jgi:hypothetical protein